MDISEKKNVRSYGAVGDGVVPDTAAIQAAIDACHADGGGEVFFPAGTYLSGMIRLKENVTLNLGPGSVVAASRDPAAYERDVAALDYCDDILRRGMFSPYCLIYAEAAQHIGIMGSGTIDGMWSPPGDSRVQRPMLIRIVGCTDVLLSGVTLSRPPSFTCYFEFCSDIRIQGVSIRSRTTPNGDGLDFNGCEDVRISGCSLDCGDDAISLKPLQRGRPSRRFLISDCVVSSAWAAIRLGPESYGGMDGIVVTNCIFHDCRDGLKIQNCEGAIMENMLFSNILMQGVSRPFFFTLNRFRFSKHCAEGQLECGILRNIRCSNIRAISRRPCSDSLFEMACNAMVGLPGHCIDNVSLSGIDFTMPGGGTCEDAGRVDIPEIDDSTELWPEAQHFGGPLPSSALYVRHVRQLSLSDIRVFLEDTDQRPFIAGNDAHNISVRAVSAGSPPPQGAPCQFTESSNVVVQ